MYEQRTLFDIMNGYEIKLQLIENTEKRKDQSSVWWSVKNKVNLNHSLNLTF